MVVLLIVPGTAYRAAISARAPVSYDEAFVMGIGIDEMLDSPRAFFIDVPLRRSNAVAPLWWWVQAVPSLVSGGLSLPALRVVPLLLGAGTLVLAYVCAAPRVGRAPALFFLALIAFSDVLAFTNARGEYAESLLVALTVPALALAGTGRGRVVSALLWSLMLLTHFGKGIFLVSGLALVDSFVLGRRIGFTSTLRRVVTKLLLSVCPIGVWLVVAAMLAPEGGIDTDIGKVSGPLSMLEALTVRYAETKPHMISSTWEALQIWRDPWIWPLSCVSGPLLVIGAVGALVLVHGRRRRLAAALVIWCVVGIALVAGRGLIGARFHLLYLPALWFVAAIGLCRILRVARRRSSILWPAGLATPAGMLACAAIGLLALARGPIRWAPFARFEPYAGSDERAVIDAHRTGGRPLPPPHGRTLRIDLANYFLLKEASGPGDRDKAVFYAEREATAWPDDARAWYYVARARQSRGDAAGRVREAAERSHALRPSPQTRKLLEALPR